MRRSVFLMIWALIPLTLCGQVTFERDDSVTICRLLQKAPHRAGSLWFARHFLGRPYVAHTLEVNDTEQLVVNTRQLDCTTLVETVVALTLCHEQGKKTWQDYLNMLQTLRYRQGVLQGYPSRLHYFSDWIDDKEQMRLVQEIQGPNPPFTAVQLVSVDFMSTHPQYYKSLTALRYDSRKRHCQGSSGATSTRETSAIRNCCDRPFTTVTSSPSRVIRKDWTSHIWDSPYGRRTDCTCSTPRNCVRR